MIIRDLSGIEKEKYKGEMITESLENIRSYSKTAALSYLFFTLSLVLTAASFASPILPIPDETKHLFNFAGACTKPLGVLATIGFYAIARSYNDSVVDKVNLLNVMHKL